MNQPTFHSPKLAIFTYFIDSIYYLLPLRDGHRETKTDIKINVMIMMNNKKFFRYNGGRHDIFTYM